MTASSPEALAQKQALSLLKKRVLSSHQLREKLRASEHDEVVIDKTLGYLCECGYLNDQHLIDTLLDKARRESRGSLWLEQNLKERQLDGPAGYVAQSTLAQEEPSLAQAAIGKRYASPMSPADSRRASQYLGRRGFQPETVETIISAACTP